MSFQVRYRMEEPTAMASQQRNRYDDSKSDMTKKQDKFNIKAEIWPLSGGGRLAIEFMPGLESFSLGFFLPVGAAHEPASLSGISHFIEHMLFKGTNRRNPKQIVQAIERVGGLINASTGREATYYFVRVGSSRLDLALDVLVDVVFNPLFDPQAMGLEKGVILEEMHMTEDDPEQALYDRFLRGVHGNTAFGRPILGSESTLMSFNPNTIKTYHRENYNQSRLIASIAGGIDPERVFRLLEKRLARFPVKARVRKEAHQAPTFKPRILAYSKDVEQAALLIGCRSAGVNAPERYSYTILDAISAGGMMSRLFQEVREKRGLVYSIDSTQQPYSKGGIFTVEAGCKEENILKVTKLVFREFKSLMENGPGKKELADTKVYLKGHWALGLESSTARMIRNAMSMLFFNRLIPHDEMIAHLDAVTQEDVVNAASKMFENGGPAVGVLAKFGEKNGVKEMEEKIRALVEKA